VHGVKELTLFTPPPAQPRALTEHQQEALEHVRQAGQEGIRAQELGEAIGAAPLHRTSAGTGLLKALKKKGWVTQRKGAVYVAIDAPTGDDFGHIPF